MSVHDGGPDWLDPEPEQDTIRADIAHGRSTKRAEWRIPQLCHPGPDQQRRPGLSRPDNPLAQGYSTLLDDGYSDAWSAVHPADPGLTCCRNDDLSGGTLDERIDYVLERGPITPLSASVIDVAPRAAASPRWPAYHAGVVATVAIGVQ